MGTSISAQTAAASAEGTDLIPIDKGGAGKKLLVSQVSTKIVDDIEGIAAGVSVAAGNGIYCLQSGVLKPVDIDIVLQKALDTMWAKADEATLADGDKLPMYDISPAAEQTITLSNLATYVRTKIEAAILDVSDLSDGSGTLATTDYMLVTQGTTGKRITVQNLYDAIYAGLAAHVAAATNQASPAGTDLLYLVRGTTPYRVTLTNLATYVASTATLDGSGTADYLAKWTDANTLAAGYAVVTSFDAGTDDAMPTSKAVRDEMNSQINDATVIGAALADGDLFLLYDLSVTAQRNSAVSRIYTYLQSKLVTTDLPITGGTDIGAALASTDELVVYDLSATANRKCALSRVKTYVDTVGTYKTIWIPAKAMTASVTAGATASTVEYTTTNDMTHAVMVFAGLAADTNAEFDLLMPEAWDLGTIKAKVFWSPGDAAANVGEYVGFYLAGGARSDDDPLDAANGTEQLMADQALADEDMHVSAASPAITIGGTPALNDLIHFKLRRDFDYAGAGAAMDVDARVFGILIQYQENVVAAAW